MPDSPQPAPSPLLVGILAWLVPGGGYFILGHRTRAITVGVTIITLFLSGIVIGGIRVMDPPGWGEYGYMDQLVQRYDGRRQDADDEASKVEPTSLQQAQDPRSSSNDQYVGPALWHEPMNEVGDKPWYVGQILCGPITLATSIISVQAAHPTEEASSTAAANSAAPVERWPPSHSRSWEIGALYTAVAGMLNLLVIIDSAARAGRHKLAGACS
jgi:hypothetical protein